MKAMEEECIRKKYTTLYIEHSSLSSSEEIVQHLPDIQSVELFDPVDEHLHRALIQATTYHSVALTMHDSPGFLLMQTDIDTMLPKEKTRYSQSSFYSAMRKKFRILVDENNKPLGGKWSPAITDKKAQLKDLVVPKLPRVFEDFALEDAKKYIQQHFPDNPGDVANFYLPTTHEDALPWLITFLHTKLRYYGDFENIVRKEHPFLYHSTISPLLNIGLLTPHDVIEQVLSYSEKHDIPLTSVEGFIRQVLGWREFMRGVYVQQAETMQSSNFMEANNPLPDFMYTAQSGLLPLDNSISKVMKYGHCSHLERLMIIGNFMLLKHIRPSEVHRWFIEMFVDSYDWVTVPNVYALSQFSTGPFISTKPYTSGSAYILCMSDYGKGPWTAIWDGLFWQFIEQHKAYYKSNHRIKMMPKVLRRMSKEKKKELWKAVEEWEKSLKK